MLYFRISLYLLLSSVLSLTSINIQAQETTVEKTTTTTTGPTPTTVVTTTPVTTAAPPPSTLTGRPMIVTPVPTAKETISTPEGYINCFTIEPGWYKNAWVPEHRVCQYNNVPGQAVTYEGVAWIEGYWACTGYTETTCTKWEWRPGHWVKTLEVY